MGHRGENMSDLYDKTTRSGRTCNSAEKWWKKPVWVLKFHSKKPLLDRMDRKSNPSRLWKWLQVPDSREINGAPGGIRTPDLLVRSRTIKFHKLMNRRHMPVSHPLSIGLQIGLRARPRGNAETPLSKNAKARIS